MISALWTSAAGLVPHETNIDIIANNIANINTTGFKKGVSRFQDIFYQHALSYSGSESGSSSETTSSLMEGSSLLASHKVFDQGRLELTDDPLDVAIEGDGFFKVLLQDGTPAYTRDGGLRLDEKRQLVTPQGYQLEPSITIPEGGADIKIGLTGKVFVKTSDESDYEEIGQINLFEAKNLDGLFAVGENLFLPTGDVGGMIEKIPGSDGAGLLHQGFLESSNVDIADEMARLVVAHRAYDISARALKTADEMLTIANAIKG